MSHVVSRRRFLTTSGVAIALAPVGRLFAQATVAPPAPTQTPQAPRFTPAFTDIRRNVSFFTGRGGTIGYLVNSGGIIVVDSQFPDAAKAFLDGLGERTNHRPVEVLLNTHHHADHTGGNTAFKGVAKTIVAQNRVPALQKADNDAAATPVEQAYADTTFDEVWNHGMGDEMVRARTFTPAHTGGDIVVYFEQANVVHVGDLVWNNLQTFVDHTRGGSAVNWIPVCERIAATYPKDAVYICGHANRGLPVTVTVTEVLAMRDYLTALVEHVRKDMAAGKSRDQIVSSTDVLPGFEPRGPLTKRALEGTYDELAGK
jgi:glyoxylase-like metal-dependent hydrolase (beta-lactamase superfamily II)